jgi:hypothetical protein
LNFQCYSWFDDFPAVLEWFIYTDEDLTLVL